MNLISKTSELAWTRNGKQFRRYRFLLKCQACGDIVERIAYSSLTSETCGCVPSKLTHGLTNHPTYTVWRHIKERCYSPKDKSYKRYGGRGITVCKEWHDPQTFCDWAILNGWEPGLLIERKNNNGNYEPSNCCFKTITEQQRNRSDTKLTLEKSEQIRMLVKSGESQRSVASKFGITHANVWLIVHNKTWKQNEKDNNNNR